MNTINAEPDKDSEIDSEILKTLLGRSYKSVYDLTKDMKKTVKKEYLNINYATTNRHLHDLLANGFVREEQGKRKNGQVDKRGTKILSLSYKGLVFLILRANLNEDESRFVIQQALSEPGFKRFDSVNYQTAERISTDSLQKTLLQMRSKVNLEFYDETYVKNLAYETFLQNLLNEVLEWKEKLPKEDLERKMKKARKDLNKIQLDWVRMAFIVYEHLKAERNDLTSKIEQLRPIINVLEKVGIKP